MESQGYDGWWWPPQRPWAPQPDRLQDALGWITATVEADLRLPLEYTVEFTLLPESWLELQQDANFQVCKRRLFRASFDSSRSVVTIMAPRPHRHRAVVRFLADLARKTISDRRPDLSPMLLVPQGEDMMREFEGEYKSSQIQPDVWIHLPSAPFTKQGHTMVEVGVYQPLKNLRALVPLYMKGYSSIQRVILVKITETPVFSQLAWVSIERPQRFDFSQDFRKEFRKDMETGEFWFGDVRLTGKIELFWEVWERNATGDAEKTFEEWVEYGSAPSRNLPFIHISGMEVPITPEMMKGFWNDYFDYGSMKDAFKRAFESLDELWQP
ncbi:hypothetical protein AYL99_11851 [Fonsecaea erecta]|uniref:Uncharacterized protein n=1 Tax=Fonsecaea erecta TaxID=1367422 RepID=A0A178Z371_9EURO|nr:hypothetical protein AYL99_11851 [Fonsecaea erecta]OAP53971.1 hypothetical protein AYL99_11851 [Fonsecaea erecta]